MTVLESGEMLTESELLDDLQTLNEIALALNQSADVRNALDRSLSLLVELMGLNTGWIFIIDPEAGDRWGGVASVWRPIIICPRRWP